MLVVTPFNCIEVFKVKSENLTHFSKLICSHNGFNPSKMFYTHPHIYCVCLAVGCVLLVSFNRIVVFILLCDLLFSLNNEKTTDPTTRI